MHAFILYGQFQMVCLKQGDQRVLGLHLTGPNAGEILQGFTVAMRYVCM